MYFNASDLQVGSSFTLSHRTCHCARRLSASLGDAAGASLVPVHGLFILQNLSVNHLRTTTVTFLLQTTIPTFTRSLHMPAVPRVVNNNCCRCSAWLGLWGGFCHNIQMSMNQMCHNIEALLLHVHANQIIVQCSQYSLCNN